MQHVLRQLRNIPITSSVIASLYPTINQSARKVVDLEEKGEIIRLKRGLYVVNPEISDKTLSTELIANHLCTPSFISMQTALRYYGLIPEMVCVVQSMTTRQKRSFTNSYGRFDYIHTNRESFHVGVTQETDEGVYFLIATPERALCDLIAYTKGLNLRYRVEVQKYLEEDIRFDMDFFATARLSIFEEYASLGRKSNSIITLINWMKNERNIG